MDAKEQFAYWLENWSDIQDHLQRFYESAKGNVVELGTRKGVSTSALLAGIEDKGGFLWSVDMNGACAALYEGHPQWKFIQGDSRKALEIIKAGEIELPLDLLFIDTEHDFEQVYVELCAWAPLVREGGRIYVHDVLTFPEAGRACMTYALRQGLLYEVAPGSNGLGMFINA